jgi:hypothetical protein
LSESIKKCISNLLIKLSNYSNRFVALKNDFLSIKKCISNLLIKLSNYSSRFVALKHDFLYSR